jgi:dienelactone hydrolase
MHRYLGIAALCTCAVPGLVAQTVALPTPTGPYAVGRTRFDWVDPSRPDIVDTGSSSKREIVVWVWYPAAPTGKNVAVDWLPGKWGDLYASELRRVQPDEVQPATPAGMQPVLAHAYQDAPVTAGREKYPVLVFSPGFGVLPTTYTALIEDIVSHGYVVAGIVPTYFVPVTMFDDGRTAAGRSLGPVVSLSTLVGDVGFTIDRLTVINAEPTSPLRGRLDLERVAAFGHSRGGATSLQAAKQDPRITAAVDIDGTLLGSVAQLGIAKPVAIILSGEFLGQQRALESAPPDDPRRRVLDAYDLVFRSASPGYKLILPATTHMSFSDMGWLSFMSDSYKAQLGSIDRARALRVTEDYLEAFFDQHLKGMPSPLLAAPSPHYPEVRFETHRAQ